MSIQLTKPIYYVEGEPSIDTSRSIQIHYGPGTRDGKHALNLMNYAWMDTRYQIALRVLHAYPVVVTDSDLVGCEDYITELQRSDKATVVLVFRGISLIGANNSYAGASKRRLRAAARKLKALGIKVRYCASEASMLRLLSKIGGAK